MTNTNRSTTARRPPSSAPTPLTAPRSRRKDAPRTARAAAAEPATAAADDNVCAAAERGLDVKVYDDVLEDKLLTTLRQRLGSYEEQRTHNLTRHLNLKRKRASGARTG